MGERPCPICATPCRCIGSRFDDRYGYPGTFPLHRCPQCGHLFLDAQFSPEELGRLYTDYYPRANFAVSDFRPAREGTGVAAALDGIKRSAYLWVPERVRVLDIGCGLGHTLAYHASRGCDAYGVEADQNVRAVAEAHGLKINVGLFDPELYPAGFFDYVTLDQVIEHMADPVTTLRGVARVLKPGGRVVVSTPNANGWGARVFGRRWINWHAPYHLQHFSARSMGIAAEQGGLDLTRARTLTSSEWLHYQWCHIATFPAPGGPSPFWSEQAERSLRQRVSLRLLELAHRSKLNHLATRLFDSAGLGDNYLFFLEKR